jgi:hypothetical protein
MRFTGARHGRPVMLAAAAAGLALTGTALISTAPAVAAPAGGTAGRLSLSGATQHQLLGLYASYRHVPAADVARTALRSARGATAASGTDWAAATYVPSQAAPLSVRVGFQDGGDRALFTRAPGHGWKVAGLGGQALGCDTRVPAAVRRAWGFGSCPAGSDATRAATAPRSSSSRSNAPRAAQAAASSTAAASGTAADIASIALSQVGVADTPADSSFANESADCDPYTALENPSAPDSLCGTDPTFGIKDHAEFWCSDFAKYVWLQGGVTSDESTITPLSSSFYTWGLDHGESMPVDGGTPAAGDAIVLYPSGTSGTTALEDDGDHVGIVTAVHSDGTIDIVNGDFLTSSGIKVAYYQDQNPATFAANSEGSGEEWLYVSPQLPSGAGPDLQSSSVTTYTQQLQVFGRDSSGATESDVWTPGKSWSGFKSIGGNITDDPTALEYDTSTSGQQMEVFGKFGSTVYANVWTPSSGTWSGWKSLGGTIASDPVAIQYGTQMQVWGVQADGSVVSDVYTPGKTWSGFNSIGGTAVGNVSVVNYGTQLEVYARQSDGSVQSDVWTPGQSWSGWKSIGGDIAGNPVAAQFGTQLQVWGRAADGSVTSTVWTPGKSWSSWNSIGGDISGDPSVVEYNTSNYGTQLEVYGQENGVVSGIVWSTSSGKWSTWASIGGNLTDDPVAIQYGSQMEVWGREANGQTYSDVYTPGQSWTGWKSIGGNLLP